jgi:hypothetical protein
MATSINTANKNYKSFILSIMTCDRSIQTAYLLYRHFELISLQVDKANYIRRKLEAAKADMGDALSTIIDNSVSLKGLEEAAGEFICTRIVTMSYKRQPCRGNVQKRKGL